MAVDHNNPQSRDEEILIATIDGKEYDKIPQSRMEELLLELKETIEEGGGGGGTSDYENLSNQPQVNGETLIGDKTGADLGLVDAVEGKDLSTNDYDDNEKAAVAAATSAISAMKDGTDLDSFGDVEVALLDKADVSDLGTAAAKDSTNVVTSGSTDLVESGAVKDAIDVAVAAAYHHAGTKTVAQLTHDLLIASNEGNVYNITDSGTTTSDFIEGIGKTIDEGSNVGICKVENTYMFDLLSGFVDTTNFVQKSQTAGLLKNDGTVDTVEKQPKTDNNLTTTSKDTTGAINEVKGGVETLDAWTSADTKTVTGNPITLTDAAAVNAKALSMSIEPVQDLHGYDKPWVGGAGKNKFNLDLITKTVSDVTITVNGDGTFSTNGTASADININILGYADTVEGTTYKLNGCPSGGGDNTYKLVACDVGGGAWYSDTGDGVSNISYDRVKKVKLFIASGANVSGKTFKPMVYLNSETDATFAPYTNICPISGHTEAVVTRDGVNLFGGNSTSNPQYVGDYYINDANYNWSRSANSNHNCFDVEVFPSTSYRMVRSNVLSTVGQLRFLDRNKEFIRGATLNPNVDNAEIVTPSNCKYIEFATSKTSQYYTSINYPSTDTNVYTEWNRKTYTLALGDTIYGGTVDFDSGVMTVDRALLTLDGTEQGWSTDVTSGGKRRFSNAQLPSLGYTTSAGISAVSNLFKNTRSSDYDLMDNVFILRYINNTNRIDIMTEQFADVTEWTTFLGTTNMQVLYMLATPTTIQLTPQQIQLLKGTNTITANGATISLTYQPDNLVGEVMEQVDEKIAEVESKIVTENTLYDGEKVPINFNLPASASMKPLFTGKYGIDAGVGSGDLLNIITSKTPIDLTDVDTIEFVGLFNNWELSSSFIYDVDVSAITGSKYISIGYESTLQNAGVVYAITDTDTVTSADCTRIKTTTGANTISLFTKIALL